MIEARALDADQETGPHRQRPAKRPSRMEARLAEFEATVRTALNGRPEIRQFHAGPPRKACGDPARPIQCAG